MFVGSIQILNVLLCRQLYKRFTSCRNVFTETYLGINKYKEDRTVHKNNLNLSFEEYKKLLENVSGNAKLSVLSEDIKRMSYLVDSDEDLQLFEKLLMKYCSRLQNSKNLISFQSFTIDPIIMRMYYFLNKPIEALTLIEDSKYSVLFNHISSYFILQNLLYKNKLYDEVCRIYNLIEEKQFLGRIYQLNSFILFQAACYKLNTDESYLASISRFYDYIQLTPDPIIVSIIYVLIHAVVRNEPELALKYIKESDPAITNIKLSALIKAGKFNLALNDVEKLVKQFKISAFITEDNWHRLEIGLTEYDDKDLLRRFEDIKKILPSTRVIKKRLDDLAKEKIRAFCNHTHSEKKRKGLSQLKHFHTSI